jgi:neutral ceramidase
MDNVLVGHARECITPPLGIRMVGYASRTEGAADVHDDLFVNVVAIEHEGERVALLTYDVCLLTMEQADEFRAALQGATGLDADRILLNTTHTHAGPALGGREESAMQEEYRADVIRCSVRALCAAMAEAGPAAFSAGTALLDIGCNRRERMADGRVWLGEDPEGPTLHEVDVWRFARRHKPDVVLFSTPLHGTTLGEWNLTITGEWMGRAVQRLECRRPGARFVFLQGCGANQNPYSTKRAWGRGTFGELEQHARDAADGVEQALSRTRDLSALPLRVVARAAELPPKEEGAEPKSLRLQGIRLGEAMLVAMSAEVFVEYALFGRRASPAEATLVLGYSNGNIGYLPTAAAYPEGGYEIDATKVGPGAEQIVHGAIEGVFGELAG